MEQSRYMLYIYIYILICLFDTVVVSIDISMFFFNHYIRLHRIFMHINYMFVCRFIYS